MTDIFLVVRSSDGFVINAAVGEPVPAVGEEIVPRVDQAADAWIGWIRQSDGTFVDPKSEDNPEA
jgi:hypothetical protein